MTVRRIPGTLPVAFRYTPGVGNTAFLDALRDRGVLLGSRCEDCGVTYLPARIFCERCLAELEPAVECGPEGTLESWTSGSNGLDGDPLETPKTFGLVKLDGADTVLLHEILGVAAPHVGMRVRAALRGDRAGSILDIEGFGPA